MGWSVLARPDPQTQKSEFYALPSNFPPEGEGGEKRRRGKGKKKEREGKKEGEERGKMARMVKAIPLEGVSRDLHAFVTSFGRRPREDSVDKEIRLSRRFVRMLRKILQPLLRKISFLEIFQSVLRRTLPEEHSLKMYMIGSIDRSNQRRSLFRF